MSQQYFHIVSSLTLTTASWCRLPRPPSDLSRCMKKLILREAKQAARAHTVVGSQDLNWYLAGSNAHYIILFFHEVFPLKKKNSIYKNKIKIVFVVLKAPIFLKHFFLTEC